MNTEKGLEIGNACEQPDKLDELIYPLIDLQLVGYCKDCHWLLPDTLCRMILWGPRQPDIAKATTEVSMVASYSLKVHPTKFGCSLWRDENNSSTANSGT